MPKKPSKTQEYFESKVIHKHGGIIDLKKLWKEEEDKELEPTIVAKLGNA